MEPERLQYPCPSCGKMNSIGRFQNASRISIIRPSIECSCGKVYAGSDVELGEPGEWKQRIKPGDAVAFVAKVKQAAVRISNAATIDEAKREIERLRRDEATPGPFRRFLKKLVPHLNDKVAPVVIGQLLIWAITKCAGGQVAPAPAVQQRSQVKQQGILDINVNLIEMRDGDMEHVIRKVLQELEHRRQHPPRARVRGRGSSGR